MIEFVTPAIINNLKDAEKLTKQLLKAGDTLYDLLVAAHEGKIWEWYGCKSWNVYCEEKLGFTKNYANKLLAHGD